MIEQIFLAAEQTTKTISNELSSNPCSSRSTSESSSGAESTDEFVPSEESTKLGTDDTTYSKSASSNAKSKSSKERLSTETTESISSLSGGSSLSSNVNSHENSPTKTPMKGDTVPFSFGPASAVRDQRRVIVRLCKAKTD
jgi:hypothetical protein